MEQFANYAVTYGEQSFGNVFSGVPECTSHCVYLSIIHDLGTAPTQVSYRSLSEVDSSVFSTPHCSQQIIAHLAAGGSEITGPTQTLETFGY
jgi:hypothetical protein